MKIKSTLRHFLAIAGSSLLAMSYSHAADGVWTQTGAGLFDWGTAANWSSTFADGANFTASFSANITANQTINLDAARTIGNIVASDGSHDYTISGANILTLDRTNPAIPVINVTTAGRALTISSVINGLDGLDKWGIGQLNLNGSAVNGFTGGIKVSSGTLNLNFANLAAPTDLVNSANALTLGGGTLLITGNTTTNTNQTLGDVTVNAGGGRILVNPNGTSRTATLTLGSITPAATGTLLIGKSSGASGTAAITTTSNTLTNGIYGGNMVYFNGTANTGYDWATTATASPGPYAISGYSGYTTTLPTSGSSGTVNYSITAGITLAASQSVNSLKITGSATALALGANTLTINSGGLLSVGSTAQTISGTAGFTGLTAGNGSGSYNLFIHQYSSTNLTISAVIGDNASNPVALVVQNATTPAVGGTGFVALDGINTFTGGIYLNNGAISVPNPGAGTGGYYALNNNNIFVSGHSVITNANSTKDASTEIYSGAITLRDGAVLEFRNNNRFFITSGAVTGNGGIFLGQAGGGATTLNFNSTANNFTGPIRYSATKGGNLTVNSLGDATSFGAGDITFGAGNSTDAHNFTYGASAIAPLTLNNRRFELTGTGATQTVSINNNSSQAFAINTDLLSTGTATKTLTLGGAGAGLSTFAGDISNGSLTTLSLTKAGTGTWTLSGTNTYNGATTVSDGILEVTNLADGSSNSSIGASGNAAASLVFGAPTATLRYTGASNVDIDRGFTMSSGTGGGATIESSGAGTLTFDNTVAINYGTASETRLLTLGGTNTSDNTFGKVIANNTSLTSFTKSGIGKWVLTNTNTYTGNTRVNAGKLIVNGNISTSVLTTVQAGATLGGSGTVGAVTINSGAFHNPGNSPGIQNTGNYSLAGTLGIEIDGAVVGTGYDQVNTTGTVSLSGLLAVTMGYTPAANALFFILANDDVDAITGVFSNAAINGNTYTLGGQDFMISYFGNQTSPGVGTFTGGNDVVLMAVVPEPGAALIGSLGLLALLRRRRG